VSRYSLKVNTTTITFVSGFGLLQSRRNANKKGNERTLTWAAKFAGILVLLTGELMVRGLSHYINYVGRDSSVGIATRYGQDGPGIESRWGRDFPQPSRPVLGLNQPPIQWVPGLFPGGKAAGEWS
jgi:hypothetical protein